jgi:Zinc knuckle
LGARPYFLLIFVLVIIMSTSNPFDCGFDEDRVPLDVLQAMGRLQAGNFDNFVDRMRVACASVCASDSESNFTANIFEPPSVPVLATGHGTAPVAPFTTVLPSSTPLTSSLEGRIGASKQYAGESLLNVLKLDLPTFCGRSDSCSAEVFLQQVQRYARAAHRTDQWLLFEVMPVVLIGDAGRWWTGRGGFVIWNIFQNEFLRTFGHPDRNRRLQNELHTRTQHPEEDFGSFVRVIAAYYERLGSLASEDEKIQRVLAQTTPFSRQMLMGRHFKTLIELENVGPEMQELVWRNQTYKPPPLPIDTMEQDLAFHPTFVHPPPTLAASVSDKCNRCGGIGHWARQCPNPKRNLSAVPSTPHTGLPSAPGNERR